MSLLTVLFSLATGYGLATVLERGKRKELTAETSKEREVKKTLMETKEQSKPEHEKNVLDIMGDIAWHDELDKFTLIERKNEKSKYQYLKNDVLFTVVVSEEFVECQVKNKEQIVLEYIFDKGWDEYDKKTVSRSLLELAEREVAMEIVEDFIYELNQYYWDELEENVEIIDDVKEVKPVEAKVGRKQNSSSNGDGFAEMERMKTTIEAQEKQDEVGLAVLNIIEKIKKATRDIELLDKELDIEAKHVYDELIKKDLATLFHAYLKLEVENRQAYKEKTLEGLMKIESKITEILEQIQHKNLHEIDAILHVIKQRYKE